MKIKINEANAAKIDAELAAVNGRATTFAVTSWAFVEAVAAALEKRLSALPVKERVGATAYYIPAGPTANAYKYKAKSTKISLERYSTGWFLTGVSEDRVYPKSREVEALTITQAQADRIAAITLSAFRIAEC